MDHLKDNIACVSQIICIFSLFGQLFELEKKRQNRKEVVLESSDTKSVLLVKNTSAVSRVNRKGVGGLGNHLTRSFL